MLVIEVDETRKIAKVDDITYPFNTEKLAVMTKCRSQ